MRSGWFRDVRTITVSAPYRTRAEALVAEAEAIKAERPLYNTQHAVNKPVEVQVAESRQGETLLRRLRARQRAGGKVETGFEDRVAAALAAIRTPRDHE